MSNCAICKRIFEDEYKFFGNYWVPICKECAESGWTASIYECEGYSWFVYLDKINRVAYAVDETK